MAVLEVGEGDKRERHANGDGQHVSEHGFGERAHALFWNVCV